MPKKKKHDKHERELWCEVYVSSLVAEDDMDPATRARMAVDDYRAFFEGGGDEDGGDEED